MAKVFAKRATCGEMNGRGPYSIHYESSHGSKDIIYNVFAWAGQKLAVGRIWPDFGCDVRICKCFHKFN